MKLRDIVLLAGLFTAGCGVDSIDDLTTDLKVEEAHHHEYYQEGGYGRLDGFYFVVSYVGKSREVDYTLNYGDGGVFEYSIDVCSGSINNPEIIEIFHSHKYFTSGDYYVSFDIDIDDKIDEVDEGNNSWGRMVTIP